MKQWIGTSEKAALDRKVKEEESKQKKKEVQEFLLKQMGAGDEHQSAISLKKKVNGKQGSVVAMSTEEFRLNK